MADLFWLSAQQKHVWLTQGENSPWNTAALVLLESPAGEEQVRAALEAVVARHEVLRTVFRAHPGMKVPFQEVLESCPPSWEKVAGQTADELFRAGLEHRFDLQHGPVAHATFARLGEDRAALVLSLPVLVSDAASLNLLIRELGSFCKSRAQDLDPEPLRYVQFAQWQADLLESGGEGQDYWTQQKAAQHQLGPLPGESAKSDTFQPATVSTTLPGAPDSEALLAAWQVLLSRLTGQALFPIPVLFPGREMEELANAPGLMAKYLPILARFDGDYRFRDTREHVRAAVAAAAEWQEFYVPQDADPSPAFEYSELPPEVLREESCSERYRLKLSAQRTASGLRLDFHYDSNRLEGASVERWAGSFVTLLTYALENPDTPVSRLPLLKTQERTQALERWNQTAADYPRAKCLHSLFEEQVARTPGRLAVRGSGNALTYRELNQRANQLARHLQRSGVKSGSLVGLCVDDNLHLMTALLAILKAGGAYVPLNAGNPKPRLAQQLAGAAALMVDQRTAPAMPAFSGPIVYIDSGTPQWTAEPDGNLEAPVTPEDLVYVIYTSGSTGVPKGVAVRHRNLVNYAWFLCRRLELERFPEGLQFATVSTLSADLGNTCIFPSLISGGCLHVLSQDAVTDSARLAAYQRQYPIDVLKIVPSHLAALLETAAGAGVLPRRYLILGGEALKPRLVERIRELGASCEILNHYGPTETTVGSLTLRLKDYAGDAPTIPIGRPIANTQVYILDPQQEPVPVGVAGELYIAGDGVAAGYLNQPERTRERFLANPFLPGSTMYRTGDLARYSEDGTVEFLGRADDQVKIRGYRVEPGEIESVLLQHGAVRQALVMARPDPGGNQRLIAYVAVRREHPAETEELRAYLKEQLPEHMVPAAIVLLQKLPLTTNGKIDRQALPEPEAVQSFAVEYVPPNTPTELAVAGIWAEVFHRVRIGINDNFFDLGGHSLLATQVISRVREHFHTELAMRVLFDRPTIRGLAEALDATRASSEEDDEAEILPVSREAYRLGRS